MPDGSDTGLLGFFIGGMDVVVRASSAFSARTCITNSSRCTMGAALLFARFCARTPLARMRVPCHPPISRQINTSLGFLHGSMVAPWMQALHFFFGLGAFLAPLALGESIAAANGHLWKLGWTHFFYGGLG